MIELAEQIGAQFDFVRVDLYSPPQGIFFGEFAFYPNAGLEAFTCNEWDYRFGEPWKNRNSKMEFRYPQPEMRRAKLQIR